MGALLILDIQEGIMYDVYCKESRYEDPYQLQGVWLEGAWLYDNTDEHTDITVAQFTTHSWLCVFSVLLDAMVTCFTTSLNCT